MKPLTKSSTYASKEADKKEFLRQLYKNDLYVFCKDLLGYSDITWNTHREVIECLERKSNRKLIVLPRGTFKSSIGVVGYSIWSLIRNPNERIMIDSEVYQNSKNFIREIKGHIKSERFMQLFGDLEGANWNEGEITLSNRTKVLKEASVTASGIGAVKVGQHFDKIIMDDINSGNNSDTAEMREKVIRHYQLSLAILEPAGTMVIIGTRYATNDAPGYILENEVEKEIKDLYVT